MHLIAALLLSSPARAADVFVCGAGVAPPCFVTVQEAVDAAYDGDRVSIPVGLYAEAVVLDHRTLTLEGGQAGGLLLWSDLTGTAVAPPLTILGGDVTLVGLALRPTITRALEVSQGATVTGEGLVMVAGGGVAIDGGLMSTIDSTVTLTSCTLSGGQAVRYGGVVYASGGSFGVLGTIDAPSTVTGGRAGTAGGLIHADDVVLENAALEGGEAALGGALSVASGGHASVSGTWQRAGRDPVGVFRDNVGTTGGAIYVGAGGGLELDQVSFFDTTGGLLYLGAGATLDARAIHAAWTDGPFLSGSGEAGDLDGGGPSRITESVLCGATSEQELFYAANVEVSHSFLLDSTTEVAFAAFGMSFVHNHIVGNSALQLIDGITGNIEHNLLAHNLFPATSESGLGQVIRRNLWWDNQNVDELDGGSLDSEPILGDPMLLERARDEDCSVLPKLYPSWYGAARDALVGDGTYLGGGLPMPGVWGGIDEPFLYVENGEPGVVDAWTITGDGDADQVVNFFDCKRIDDTVFPGAEDAPYDGIDSDCLGNDDFDADGDGERSAAEAADGTDCDDQDPERGALREEIDGNGKDDDCNGWADAEIGLTAVGCVSSDPRPALLPMTAALLALLGRGARRAPFTKA